jgi:hypothetical protein
MCHVQANFAVNFFSPIFYNQPQDLSWHRGILSQTYQEFEQTGAVLIFWIFAPFKLV